LPIYRAHEETQIVAKKWLDKDSVHREICFFSGYKMGKTDGLGERKGFRRNRGHPVITWDDGKERNGKGFHPFTAWGGQLIVPAGAESIKEKDAGDSDGEVC